MVCNAIQGPVQHDACGVQGGEGGPAGGGAGAAASPAGGGAQAHPGRPAEAQGGGVPNKINQIQLQPKKEKNWIWLRLSRTPE